MSSAFPLERRVACSLPDIPAVEGDLITTCELCEITPLPKFNPLGFPIPAPPSADFGCYPFSIYVDFDPDEAGEPEFSATVQYLTQSTTGYCRPQLRFRVRMPAGACSTIEVDAATTLEITLSGYQTVDGVAVTGGDKVLVKNQTDKTENDVYSVFSGAWQRFQTAGTCNIVLSRFGDQNARTIWQMSNETEPNHGTDEITFEQIGGGQVTCRVRYLLYADETLTGLITVDGVDVEEGDLVVVDFSPVSDADVRAKTGIYAASALAWTQLFKVDPAALPVDVPALATGTIISIFDGYSYPWLYVVGQRWVRDM